MLEGGLNVGVGRSTPNANTMLITTQRVMMPEVRSAIPPRKTLGRNGAEKLAPAYKAKAAERAKVLAPILGELQAAGLSARCMADELNRRAVATLAGGRWHAQTVIRVLDRL